MSKSPLAALLLLAVVAHADAARAQGRKGRQPAAALVRLSETGLFQAGNPDQLHSGVMAFAPQYALWSDGATKRRWMALPAGGVIDARRADAWVFPVGTRFWKEFSVNGRRVETRTLERLRGGWRFSTYEWNADGSDARLAPDAGGPTSVELAAGVPHVIPSRADCHNCHDDPTNPVLGATLLQLSPDRDPRAPHAEALGNDFVTLETLMTRGLLRGLPRRFIDKPPRVEARNDTERAALGYLNANCAGCHNGRGALASLGMRFDIPADGDPEQVLASLVDRASHFRAADATIRVAPGRPEASVLFHRVRSRTALAQMPPLATSLPDVEGLSLLREWITQLSPTHISQK